LNKNKIRKIIESNLKVIKNFGYLSILQIFSILLPLVTYPYLIRVLGSGIYGTVVYAQAIITYFSLIINFGFNISGTKKIAENIKNIKKLSEIVSSIYIIKFFLFLVSFFILLICFYFIPSIRSIWVLVLFSFTATLNELLFPQWYFQGVDKMKYITLLNVSARVLFTLLIFFVINDKGDYLYVPIISGVGLVITGLTSLYILIAKEGISFIKPEFSKIVYYFKDSIPLFISAASVQVYVNSNRVLVGAFLGMSEVAYYDLGEKVLRLVKIPVGMLGQAAFPTLSREKNISKINQVMIVGVSMTVILTMLVYVFSEDIVILLGSASMLNAVDIMRILSLAGIMVAFSQFLGTSRLIIFGFKKRFTQIIGSSGLFFAFGFLVLYLFDWISIYTLAWLAVLVETWVTLWMLILGYIKKILV
jgi:PST family polysaccharide transporter